jgi:hypothetical protein
VLCRPRVVDIEFDILAGKGRRGHPLLERLTPPIPEIALPDDLLAAG